MKKFFQMLFLVLVALPSYADEQIFLPDVTRDSLSAAEQALTQRKWTIVKKDESSVSAHIARFGKDTRADIVIYYRDNTLYFDGKAITQVQKKVRNSSQRVVKDVEISIPERWVRKLQRDTTRILDQAPK